MQKLAHELDLDPQFRDPEVRRAAVDWRDSDGRSSLMVAAMKGRYEIAKEVGTSLVFLLRHTTCLFQQTCQNHNNQQQCRGIASGHMPTFLLLLHWMKSLGHVLCRGSLSLVL